MAMKSSKTKENAVRVAALIDEIVQREKCTKTAVFRRLGIAGDTMLDIVRLIGCTPTMLARVETEHARVFGKSAATKVPAAAKADEDESAEEDELEEDEDEANEEDDEDEDEDEGESDENEDESDELVDDENEGDDRPRRVPARDLDEVPVPRPRFGPTEPGKGAPLVEGFTVVDAAPATGKTEAARAAAARLSDGDNITAAQLPGLLSALARTVAVIEQLGGIERAERIAAAIGGTP